MRITEVKLCNIKKMMGLKIFKFDDADVVNTISGKNGSGKSTIFESVVLCQKAYFIKILEDFIALKGSDFDIEKEMKEFSNEIQNLAVNKNAEISLKLRFYEHDLIKIRKIDHFQPTSDEKGEKAFDVCIELNMNKKDSWIWRLDIDEGNNNGILNEFWNIQNPSQIIVYLDADKNVYEDNFSYQKISMIADSDINPIVDFILHPKYIYQHMYDIMMNAYVYQRINPQTPKKDLFFSQSKKMYHELIPDIEISKFSGKESRDQFVLISKSKNKFDARNMSSGEKLVWYSLLVLNYVRKLGVLIIDEPENHLHEQLAWQFISFLKKKANEKKDFYIEQIFLITHAKNLIYNNFADGINYLINCNGDIYKIQKEECENILRLCGISYIDDRVLFIEGKTEENNLSKLCGKDNIRIRQLSNCAEIIRVFESLIKVKELVYAPQFIFVIDKDTREDDEIKKIRELDEEFYDQHFAVLPVHEFENFMLDEKTIADIVNEVQKISGEQSITETEILNVMKKYADDSLEETKKKFINNTVRETIKSFETLVKQREIVINSKQQYENYIDSLFSSQKYKQIIEKIKEKYEIMNNQYEFLNWSSNWKMLCDGKRVLSQSISEIGQMIGYDKNKIEKALLERLLNDKKSEMYIFWNDIIAKLK